MTYSRPFLRNGTAIKARPGSILTDDQIRAVAPSVFATEAHESRSSRFAPVPTINVINGLRNEGFDVVSASQARSRDDSRRDYTKHMLRLRHRGDAGREIRVGSEFFEIVLVNANDGTSAYHMLPGVFRLVCLNGLMTGDTYDEVKVRHSGNAVGDVIEGAYRVLSEAPRVKDQVEAFRAITLNRDERHVFAEAAHALRFEDETPIRADAMLMPRRRDDTGTDLWTTLNVAQENVIRGGMTAMGRNAAGQRRRTTTREVQGIDQTRALNRALWTLTERMAQLKSAA